jgi:hypothetical protein
MDEKPGYYQPRLQTDGKWKLVWVPPDEVGRKTILAMDRALQWFREHPEELD